MKMNAIILGICLTGSLMYGDSASLQNITKNIAGEHPPLPTATIYTAKEIITLDPNKPKATAVAVVGDRILATGSLEKLKAIAGDQPYKVDTTFAQNVMVPGFIAQHDHPFLTALTMKSEIIAIEDWVLPEGTVPAAKTPEEYRTRIVDAHKKIKDPNETLLTWGYHHAFHGKLTRADIDKISTTRPIIVWHRSAHEFFFNTKALEVIGLDKDFIATMSEAAQKQSNFEEGHFWEAGMFGILNKLVPFIAAPERLKAGLEFVEQYYHANGVTVGCEPGGLYSKKLQQAINAVLSDPKSALRFYFIPDGKSIYAMFPDTAITETEKTLDWGHDMTVMVPKQIKLFADGAIYSLLMQLRDPYIGDYHGEWIMQPKEFAKAFRIYWDAGYQIHVHVTGDAAVDMALDNVEENMRRNPRFNHRTLLAHFAVSQKDQIERIKRLGVIVSGNPYYVTMLADKYTKEGLGAERADNMVRIGDVERAGISHSYHADMPMAPAQPLFLMDCAVNRTTVSGRVAGPDQRASREGALKAITLEAAYSLQLENEMGSIVPGKLANFTILSNNPVTAPAAEIKDIEVIATVQEGRKLPVQNTHANNKVALGPVANEATFKILNMEASSQQHEDHGHSDICQLNKAFAMAMAKSRKEK